MSGKTLLLFGGTGASGSHVPPHALEKGMKVVMFVRKPSNIDERYRAKVESFEGSMDDLDAVRRCLKQHQPDFILFTTALPRGQPFKPLCSMVIPAIWECLKEDHRQCASHNYATCQSFVNGCVRDQVRIVHLGGYFSVPPGQSLPFVFKAAGFAAIPALGLQGNITDANAVMDWMSKQPQIGMTSIRMWNVSEGPSKGTLTVGSTSICTKITFTDIASFMVRAVCDERLWSACSGKAVEVTYCE